jgi:hypothetical protein
MGFPKEDQSLNPPIGFVSLTTQILKREITEGEEAVNAKRRLVKKAIQSSLPIRFVANHTIG